MKSFFLKYWKIILFVIALAALAYCFTYKDATGKLCFGFRWKNRAVKTPVIANKIDPQSGNKVVSNIHNGLEADEHQAVQLDNGSDTPPVILADNTGGDPGKVGSFYREPAELTAAG